MGAEEWQSSKVGGGPKAGSCVSDGKVFESNGEEREIVMTEMDATMEKLLPLLFLGVRHEAGCSDKELESETTKYKAGIDLGKRPS